MDFQSLSEHEEFTGKGRLMLSTVLPNLTDIDKGWEVSVNGFKLKGRGEGNINQMKPEVISIKKWELSFLSVSNKCN